MRFPRSIDRGLIEAELEPKAPPPSLDFPGLLTGASLKHGWLGYALPCLADFPGLLTGASLKPQVEIAGDREAVISPVY